MIVLGASGQVGTAMLDAVPNAVGLTRSDLDLEAAGLDEIIAVLAEAGDGPVINCAAFTAVDDAENDEALATRVNGVAVGMLAKATARLGVPFVTFSTDYVFDGESSSPYVETSATGPINAYGRSKLAGERLALSVESRVLVVRTSWVVSSTHPNFVAAVLERLGSGELRVVDDQRGCPTIADDLAAATLQALDAGVTGLLHLTNTNDATWYDLAREVARFADLDPDLVQPCSSGELPAGAPRPPYSVLASGVAGPAGLAPLPPWQESLVGVVEKLRVVPR